MAESTIMDLQTNNLKEQHVTLARLAVFTQNIVLHTWRLGESVLTKTYLLIIK